MDVWARRTANHRHSAGRVRARHVVGKVEVNELAGQRVIVRRQFCRGMTDRSNLERSGPVERKLPFKDLSVSAGLGGW